jgi:hypothetical protein
MRRIFLLSLLGMPVAFARTAGAWETVALDRVPPPTVVAPRQRQTATTATRRRAQQPPQRRAPQAITSPRDVGSGQATGIVSPRDPASGLPTGR